MQDRLEVSGYAIRERSSSDRRKVVVRISDAARTQLGRLYQPLQMRSARNLGRYSRDELRLIHDFLVSSVELTADYVPTQNVESDSPGRR